MGHGAHGEVGHDQKQQVVFFQPRTFRLEFELIKDVTDLLRNALDLGHEVYGDLVRFAF